MATEPTTGGKPSDTQTSRDIAATAGNLADLLTNSKLGARVTGLVLSVEEPKNYTGKNQDGSSFSTWSRRITLFAGAAAGCVICGERVQDPSQFQPIPLGSMANWKITGVGKTDGKQMVFRVNINE